MSDNDSMPYDPIWGLKLRKWPISL